MDFSVCERVLEQIPHGLWMAHCIDGVKLSGGSSF